MRDLYKLVAAVSAPVLPGGAQFGDRGWGKPGDDVGLQRTQGRDRTREVGGHVRERTCSSRLRRLAVIACSSRYRVKLARTCPNAGATSRTSAR